MRARTATTTLLLLNVLAMSSMFSLAAKHKFNINGHAKGGQRQRGHAPAAQHQMLNIPIHPEARVQHQHYLDPSSGGPYPPLMFESEGCSMSSVTYNMGVKLLTAHGFHVMKLTDKNGRSKSEWYKPHKNHYMSEQGMTFGQAVQKQLEVSPKNELYFSKVTVKALTDPDNKDTLLKAGARVVIARRSNGVLRVPHPMRTRTHQCTLVPCNDSLPCGHACRNAAVGLQYFSVLDLNLAMHVVIPA